MKDNKPTYKMEFESAVDWSMRDLLSATRMLMELGESISEHAILSLMAGHVIDYKAEASGPEDHEWLLSIEKFREVMSDDEIEKHSLSMEVLCEVGIGILEAYRHSLREAGLMMTPMPDPNSVKVPDSADDIEWG